MTRSADAQNVERCLEAGWAGGRNRFVALLVGGGLLCAPAVACAQGAVQAVRAAADAAVAGAADADAGTRAFLIAGGSLALEAPPGWKRVQPKSGIVETEFSIPSADASLQAGRMTVMGAGGSVQANIDRWYGQFTQPGGGSTKDKATTKTMKIAGCTVTLVDIPGTFKDMPAGPFAGGQAVDRTDYRMLAAIVETPEKGNSFLKFYGPAATVGQHSEGFRTMVESMVLAGQK